MNPTDADLIAAIKADGFDTGFWTAKHRDKKSQTEQELGIRALRAAWQAGYQANSVTQGNFNRNAAHLACAEDEARRWKSYMRNGLSLQQAENREAALRDELEDAIANANVYRSNR